MINLQLSNWKSILQDIYCSVIGSIWVAPNGIWDKSFASQQGQRLISSVCCWKSI